MPREAGREGFYEQYSHKNYYEILGVSPDATEAKIKSAFRKLSVEHHPDKGGDLRTFQRISEAWSTLKDPGKRRRYDLENRIKSSPITNYNPDYSRSNERDTTQNQSRSDRDYSSGESGGQPKIFITREGDGLFRKEFLADPVTGKKLGIVGYNRIIVRDGLVIGQSGSGLLTREFLLDQKTGRSVNIAGYDRIEKRNGRIVGIKKAGISGAETIEEIANRFGGKDYSGQIHRPPKKQYQPTYEKVKRDYEAELRQAREKIDELYRQHDVKTPHEKTHSHHQSRSAYSKREVQKEHKFNSELSIKKNGAYYYLVNEEGRTTSNAYSRIESRNSCFIGTDIFDNEVLLSQKDGRELSRHYKNIKILGDIIIASTIADYEILLDSKTGKEITKHYHKLKYAGGLLIGEDTFGYQQLINPQTGKESSAIYQEIFRKGNRIIGKSFFHEEEIKMSD